MGLGVLSCKVCGAQHVRVLEGTRTIWCTNDETRLMNGDEWYGRRFM